MILAIKSELTRTFLLIHSNPPWKHKKIVERGLEGNDAPKGPKEARDRHS